MTDEDALIAAVLAAPDDDLPRLMYADWLEENPIPCTHGADCGNPHHRRAERAEFIRVQYALAECPCGGTGYVSYEERELGGTTTQSCHRARCLVLRRRSRELLAAHRLSWGFAEIESEVADRACEFRRGFVASVTCPSEAWVAHADAILARHPVREVRLTTWPGIVLSESGCGRCFEGDPNREEFDFDTRGQARDNRGRFVGGREGMLRLRWPSVRIWHLPVEPRMVVASGPAEAVRRGRLVGVMETQLPLGFSPEVRSVRFRGEVDAATGNVIGLEVSGLTVADERDPSILYQFNGFIDSAEYEARGYGAVCVVTGRSVGTVEVLSADPAESIRRGVARHAAEAFDAEVRIEPALTGQGPWPAQEDGE